MTCAFVFTELPFTLVRTLPLIAVLQPFILAAGVPDLQSFTNMLSSNKIPSVSCWWFEGILISIMSIGASNDIVKSHARSVVLAECMVGVHGTSLLFHPVLPKPLSPLLVDVIVSVTVIGTDECFSNIN